MGTVEIPAWYYQQFDADFTLDVPGEGFGGWKKSVISINPEKTALVVMHAWDCGTREQYPGWHRAVEYIPRAYHICDNVIPPILKAVRKQGMKLFHVALPGEYLKKYEGFEKALKAGGNDEPSPEFIEQDKTLGELWQFKSDHAFPGTHNREDIKRGFAAMDFPEGAKPAHDEEIALTSEQLFRLCKKYGINHLIYTGFAINGCLVSSPGGIIDMTRRGIMCSAVRQAVTAIENCESARSETGKEMGLWFVSIITGFVFDAEDLIDAVNRINK